MNMEVSEDYMEQRAAVISRARDKDILNAVFECYHYNHFTLRWGPGKKPAMIAMSEVFPKYADEFFSHAISLSQKMFYGANFPAMALLGYKEVKEGFEEARDNFKLNHPGFSEESYGLALHAAMVNNR